MSDRVKVTGAVLAGGKARRMNNQDKGLVNFKGQPMVAYALNALVQVADTVLINANRNQSRYQQLGYPVIADQTDTFDGPLAGVLTALKHSEPGVLLVIPCDTPLVEAKHLEKMLATLGSSEAEICVADDGERMHPVFLALTTDLERSLEDYLASGQRKIDIWLEQQQLVRADFSDQAQIFRNINTLEELSELEVRDT